VILRLNTDDAQSLVRELQFERYVKCAPVLEELAGLRTARRPLEADRRDAAGHTGPPRMHSPVSKCDVGMQNTEQVETHGHGGKEIAIQAVLIEHLVWLWVGKALANRTPGLIVEKV
jgi:hypothetical protein